MWCSIIYKYFLNDESWNVLTLGHLKLSTSWDYSSPLHEWQSSFVFGACITYKMVLSKLEWIILKFMYKTPIYGTDYFQIFKEISPKYTFMKWFYFVDSCSAGIIQAFNLKTCMYMFNVVDYFVAC